MHVEENQLDFDASGSGGKVTDVTSLIEVVEPSSFEAVAGRLLVHLSSSFMSWGSPGNTQKF